MGTVSLCAAYAGDYPLNGEAGGQLDVTIPITPALWSLPVYSLLLVALLLALLLTSRWVEYMTQPFMRMHRILGRYNPLKPLPHLREQGPVELENTAKVINSLQSRVGYVIDERDRLVGTLAGEMKSALIRMRTRLATSREAAVRNGMANNLDGIERVVRGAQDYLYGLRIEEESELVDLGILMQEIADRRQQLGANIKVVDRGTAPLMAYPAALNRALENLVDNAVTYGSQVGVRLQDMEDHVEVSIIDNGPGISESFREKVFEPLFRVDNVANSKVEGMGVGLGIARTLILMQGG